MKILLTNDDGYLAPGILTLAKALEEKHEVIVVAPEHEHSGKSHSITLWHPLLVRKVELEGVKGPVYSVSGTPADCVRVAMEHILEEPVDLVFSGCNLGYNAGMDIVYSGTVSAAIEANVYDIPAVAVSAQWIKGTANFEFAVKKAMEIFEETKDFVMSQTMVLNINVPYEEDIKGVKVCAMGGVIYDYYFMEPKENGDFTLQVKGRNKTKLEEGTDRYYLDKNYATVTPLIYDLTNRALIEECKKSFL
ncbi:MAG: 5'/3'-nucleotidase SurE [Tissierellia bacterium]|nr:5'/3'-nucleotidase SurE [Tissierellia bacterium]